MIQPNLEPDRSPPPTSPRSTILVVDDRPENLTLLAAVLKTDYRVRVVTQGQKALEIARSAKPPDLILLDIVMPELDGYAVCHRLKSDPKTAPIPVIFVTALEEVGANLQVDRWGAVDYILKPISPIEVQTKVRRYLPEQVS
ncbi:MAG: response regulator [Prochlorothrix sp.]